MNILLDTHIAIWAATEPRRLLVTERMLMSAAETILYFSVASLWEVRLKWSKGAAGGGFPDPTQLADYAEAVGWKMLSIEWRHALASLQAPIDNKDPFDELLLVQAQVEGLRLLTRDARLIGHPLAFS